MPGSKQNVMSEQDFYKRFDTCSLIHSHFPKHDFIKKCGKTYSSAKRALNALKANTHSGSRFEFQNLKELDAISVDGGWVIRDTQMVRCKVTKIVVAPIHFTIRYGFVQRKFITYQFVGDKYEQLETYENYDDAIQTVVNCVSNNSDQPASDTKPQDSFELLAGSEPNLNTFERKQKEVLGYTLFELLNADLRTASNNTTQSNQDEVEQSLRMEASLFDAQEQAINAFIEQDASLFTFNEFKTTHQKLMSFMA